MSDATYRQRAKALYEDEGTLEIDDNAVVSKSDGGVYVQAWVWIDDEEEEEEENA